MYWRDLTPHARELVLRMLLTQLPAHFRHKDSPDPSGWAMSFEIEEEYAAPSQNGDATMDPYSDLALAMRLGCRYVPIVLGFLLFVCRGDCFQRMYAMRFTP